MAAGVARREASPAAASAIVTERTRAVVKGSERRNDRYQRREKPRGGKARYSPALTDINTTMAMGSSRKTYTAPMTIRAGAERALTRRRAGCAWSRRRTARRRGGRPGPG